MENHWPHRLLLVVGLSLTTTALVTAMDSARRIEEHVYPATTAITTGQVLVLRGVGDADYGLWNVHTAGLYTLPGASLTTPTATGPIHLVLRYQRDLTAKNFRQATDEAFGADLSSASRASFAAPLATLNGLYESRKAGQEWRLTWIPGAGISLSDGTGERGRVGAGDAQGDAFARAVLDIWLGGKPINPSLKKQLLGP